MTPYLLIFLAGLAGSMHCVGMCGGFACAMGGDPRGPAASALRHAVYNLGRVSSYCFIGALLGHAGWLLVGPGGEASSASAAQRVLAVLSGLLMVYIGLQFLGLLHRANWATAGIEPLARALRQLVKTPGYAAPLAFGVINGFLPCPLVYAFAAQAAASGGALAGIEIMAVFGLGTFPAMLAMGGLGVWLRGSAPAAAQPIAASFLPRAGPALRTDVAPKTLRVGPPRGRERLGSGPAALDSAPKTLRVGPPGGRERLGSGPAALDSAPKTLRVGPRGPRRGSLSRPLGRERLGSGLAALDWRLAGVRVAGGFIVLLGLVTLARGALPMGYA